MSGWIERTDFPVSEGVEYEDIIDVRSPDEFAIDHISGAINLPVLSNSEREKVGKIYKQVSVFDARRLGAALISRNIADFLDDFFSDKSRDYRPLLYCWRGGQRSGSFATVLQNIGWNTTILEGGYQTYRRHVVETIEEHASEARLVILNGYAGAGKTLVLKELAKLDEQVLDLEGLANHKGSVFGGDLSNPQPAQKRFESHLYDQLKDFDSARPIFVEAESAKIGKLNLPNPLWQKMKNSVVVEMSSPLESRALNLTRDYAEWLTDLDRLNATVDRLKEFQSTVMLEHWKELAQEGDWLNLVSSLLSEHYDQLYRRDTNKSPFQSASHRVEITKHDVESVHNCAREIQGLED